MAVVTSAVVGIATGAVAAGMSFKQAADAKSAAEQADIDAKALMDEAKKNLEKNYMEELTVPLDAFEAASTENLALQQQSIEAIREGDQRGAVNVGAAQQIGANEAEKRRILMQDQLFGLEKIKAEEKDSIRDDLVSLQVAGAADENLRIRDLEESMTAARGNAVRGLGQMATSALEMAPLYKKQKTTTTDNASSVGGVTGYGTVLAPPQGGYGAPKENPYDAWDVMNYNAWEAANR